jgi:hypothetical protein
MSGSSKIMMSSSSGDNVNFMNSPQGVLARKRSSLNNPINISPSTQKRSLIDMNDNINLERRATVSYGIFPRHAPPFIAAEIVEEKEKDEDDIEEVTSKIWNVKLLEQLTSKFVFRATPKKVDEVSNEEESENEQKPVKRRRMALDSSAKSDDISKENSEEEIVDSNVENSESSNDEINTSSTPLQNLSYSSKSNMIK